MKVTNVVLSIGIAVAIFYGLAIGRALLVPFVIAVVLWYLINVLAAWGGIWGVVGMFIGVPITAVFVIICSHFAQTRPIAVLLSGDGKLDR